MAYRNYGIMAFLQNFFSDSDKTTARTNIGAISSGDMGTYTYDKATIDSKIASIGAFVVLSSGQFDPTTGKPTISSPSKKVIYLTKISSTATDPYMEWIYTTDFECIGETTLDTTQFVRANTAIVGGTKTKIVYDSKGLVTSGGDLTQDDIPISNWAKASTKPSYSYNELSDTPTIPEAQIQSDWNQTDTTKLDYIKNKPTNTITPYRLSPINISSYHFEEIYSTLYNNTSILTLNDNSNYSYILLTKPTTENYGFVRLQGNTGYEVVNFNLLHTYYGQGGGGSNQISSFNYYHSTQSNVCYGEFIIEDNQGCEETALVVKSNTISGVVCKQGDELKTYSNVGDVTTPVYINGYGEFKECNQVSMSFVDGSRTLVMDKLKITHPSSGYPRLGVEYLSGQTSVSKTYGLYLLSDTGLLYNTSMGTCGIDRPTNDGIYCLKYDSVNEAPTLVSALSNIEAVSIPISDSLGITIPAGKKYVGTVNVLFELSQAHTNGCWWCLRVGSTYYDKIYVQGAAGEKYTNSIGFMYDNSQGTTDVVAYPTRSSVLSDEYTATFVGLSIG